MDGMGYTKVANTLYLSYFLSTKSLSNLSTILKKKHLGFTSFTKFLGFGLQVTP